jgi:broad specificity phosphatase PhoE
MRIVLVRHAAVEMDASRPSAWWPLSDQGRAAARALAREPMWRDVVHVFSSPELKACETGWILASPNAMVFTAMEDLREVERPAGQWFDDYPAAVRAYFADPHAATHGWEPPVVAGQRVRACIEGLPALEPDSFCVVGHGLTLSLYLAALIGADPARIWPTIALPDVAVVDPDRGVVMRPFGRMESSTWQAR